RHTRSKRDWSSDVCSSDLRTAQQIAALLADKGERYPTVVVERDGQVIAWASAGAYRARPAYAGVAEHSVYVARAARGSGAGRARSEERRGGEGGGARGGGV